MTIGEDKNEIATLSQQTSTKWEEFQNLCWDWRFGSSGVEI